MPSAPEGTDAVRAGLGRFAELAPWLLAATDPDCLGPALRRAIPEVASGQLVLHEVEAGRLRLKGEVWRARYQLRVGGGNGDVRTVPLEGSLRRPGTVPAVDPPEVPLGESGWQVALPELGLVLEIDHEDAELPFLADLTDPDRAAPLLEASIRAGGAYPDLRIEGCTAEVMRYKPGSRCTVRYQLRFPPEAQSDGWPGVVVAKTYHGDKGSNAWGAMRALWASPLSSGPAVHLAEPLAYLDEARVLVQGPVDEDTTLKELVRQRFTPGAPDPPALDALLDRTAAGLAALHTSGAWHGEVVTLDDELAEIREVIGRLAVSLPELADGAAPLLALVEDAADRCPADPPVPSHLSFRPAQVLVHGDDISFIDFDGFGRAEPALDVALFRATVRSVSMGAAAPDDREAALDRLDAMNDAFLARYREEASVSACRIALWEVCDHLTRVLHCWTKVQPKRVGASLATLEHHLVSSGLG
jgi:hypothetical protein